MTIYTLEKCKYPDILRTTGHYVQVNNDAQTYTDGPWPWFNWSFFYFIVFGRLQTYLSDTVGLVLDIAIKQLLQ